MYYLLAIIEFALDVIQSVGYSGDKEKMRSAFGRFS